MGEFRMPSLGADMVEGTLRKWRVNKGDFVKRGAILAEVETQKGIIDIEVFESGIVGDLLVKENDSVPVGTLLTHIEPSPASVSTTLFPSEAIVTKAKKETIRASPLARKFAEENQISLLEISGSGPNGAITKGDVEIALKKVKEPEAIISKPQVSHTDIRLAIAAAMSRSQKEIPPYVVRTVVDLKPCLDDLTSRNRAKDPRDRLLLIAPLVKATGLALKDFPGLNGWWRDSFQPSEDVVMGMIISLRSGGIVVPTIKNPGDLSLEELMIQITERILHARTGHLKSSEMLNPSITVTSLGESGVESLTGIIYPPQVALVATAGVTERPWAENGMLTVRPTLEFTLSADHRATDGTYGSNFLSRIKELLSHPTQL